MGRVFSYSILLVIGLVISQIPGSHSLIVSIGKTTFTIDELDQIFLMIFMSYIMIEVGLEFTIDKKNLKSYGKDLLIAATAAAFPWLFCVAYFIYVFDFDVKYSFLLGRFAAPTSAGVLFTMLAAAGLAKTWVYQKARILAIFDDLDTMLLMIPLQMMIVGWKWSLLSVIAAILIALFYAYYFMHKVRLPHGTYWLLLYGFIIWLATVLLEHMFHVELEVILPAFCFGISIYNPKHEDDLSEHEIGKFFDVDHLIKGLFMLLVGFSLPTIQLKNNSIGMLIAHVIIITVIINLGKCFILFAYKKEATFKERLALSIAMFPRGEVGAGILAIALSYGIESIVSHIAGISLGLNLLLTGLFIYIVKWLISKKDPYPAPR